MTAVTASLSMSTRNCAMSRPVSAAMSMIRSSERAPGADMSATWNSVHLPCLSAASEARAATTDSGPRIGNSLKTMRSRLSAAASAITSPSTRLQKPQR